MTIRIMTIRSMSDEQMLAKYGYDKEPWEQSDGQRFSYAQVSQGHGYPVSLNPRPECIPSRYVAYLTLGSYSRIWRGIALDWDDACDRAGKANPKWNVHTCGTDVENVRPPVNPILAEFRRSAPWDVAEAARVEAEWLRAPAHPVPADATPQQVADARKVLERLARVGKVTR